MLIYLYNHEKFEFVRMFPRYFLIAWKKKTQQRGLHKIMIDFPHFSSVRARGIKGSKLYHLYNIKEKNLFFFPNDRIKINAQLLK